MSVSSKNLSTFEFLFSWAILVKQNISTDWEPKNFAEQPVQLALTFSLLFSAAPQFFLDFSQQLLKFSLDFLSSFKNCRKIQMFLTKMGAWHWSPDT